MPRSRALVHAGGLTVTLLALLSLPSCATRLSAGGAAIKETDAGGVAGCRLVGNVAGTSGWEGLSSAPGAGQGKNEALNDAARRGVTHVVWDAVPKGVAQSVSGKGYDCSPEGRVPKAAPTPTALPSAPPKPAPTPWPIPT